MAYNAHRKGQQTVITTGQDIPWDKRMSTDRNLLVPVGIFFL